MDYKKTNAPTNTITRDMMELCEDTGNVYETVAIIGKRSNQIAAEMKSDLSKKLQELELNFITTKKSGLLGDQYQKTTQQLYLLLKIIILMKAYDWRM